MRRLGLIGYFLGLALLACNLGSPAPAPTIPPSSVALAITSTVPVVLPTPIAATPSPSLTSCTVRADWPVYLVVTGDTLGDLAVRTGSTSAALTQANCLSDANSIYPGQQLHVPRQPVGQASTQRIQFAPGSSSGSVSGSLGHSQSFILNARAGRFCQESGPSGLVRQRK
jgi:LysM repeat protein